MTQHRYGCTATADALSRWQGRDGDEMTTCTECGWVSPATAATPRPAPRRLDDVRVGLDTADTRQATRSGSGWPRHKARERNRRRHAMYRNRKAA